ncbi:MAG: hypothetical protein FRX49_06827 [Trebouxia sp. A1-2]|nr:MAG: hypothetical protein FRX49_06827 [Trebouxia sp. A1-2]
MAVWQENLSKTSSRLPGATRGAEPAISQQITRLSDQMQRIANVAGFLESASLRCNTSAPEKVGKACSIPGHESGLAKPCRQQIEGADEVGAALLVMPAPPDHGRALKDNACRDGLRLGVVIFASHLQDASYLAYYLVAAAGAVLSDVHGEVFGSSVAVKGSHAQKLTQRILNQVKNRLDPVATPFTDNDRCTKQGKQLLTLALRSKLPLHLDIFDRTIKGSSRLPTGKDTSGPLFSLGIAIQQLQSCASTHLESSLERVQHQGWGTPRSCPASHKLTGLLHRHSQQPVLPKELIRSSFESSSFEQMALFMIPTEAAQNRTS